MEATFTGLLELVFSEKKDSTKENKNNYKCMTTQGTFENITKYRLFHG